MTQSMLGRYLVCRERFRVNYVEGLRPADQFNHKIEYGQMWHAAEEAVAGELFPDDARGHHGAGIGVYADKLCRKYPLSQEQIRHWERVCRVQFPIYNHHYRNEPAGKTLLAETVFDVPYKIPSGRVVRLRGKWDKVELAKNGVYLWDHKTKGDVDVEQIRRQLTFDLQTMFYLVALTTYQVQPKQYRLGGEGIPRSEPIKGVIYNVVRRPLSGGKGNIKQKQGETADEYYARLAAYVKDEPETYFWRWRTEITPGDVEVFRRTCLDPILDNLLDDYEWWDWCFREGDRTSVFDGELRARVRPLDVNRHYRQPFGVWNVLAEGGSTDLDEYLATGSEVGLVRGGKLFEELQ